MFSRNRRDLQTQAARIIQTLEKSLDKNTSLAERIRALFREQDITIFSILTVFLMTISKIFLAITGALGEGEEGERHEALLLHQKIRKCS